MTSPWLHIVGIGEDGMDGLTPATRAVVEAAEVVIGGDRHAVLSPAVTAERLAWPATFDAMIALIRAQRGRRAVVLVTGDPLWFSVGARIGRAIDPAEIVYHPQLSAFQLAAARMGWSLADVETVSVHGRPVAQMVAFVQPDARLLILTTGADTPAQIATYLTQRGFGQSRMTVFAAMGGADEARFDGIAATWDHVVPPFNTLAVECLAAPDAALLPRVPGLADALFQSDGTLTRQEVRAATLAKLMPMRGALLWDIGCGSGSVAIEWMRAARYARAIGIEPLGDLRAMAAANALALGTPRLDLIDGTAPECLAGLPAPDAICIGGGLSDVTFAAAWDALRPLGRLVVNATTPQAEAGLASLHASRGGDLVRIAVSRAVREESGVVWDDAMPVLQWSAVKR
ncbi:precorrin-6Y C5,15-methyltransferase (decarboxylating) [Loktanella fryxellensis]|uniref:Precorrin-6Y C5,15-methyltransferase (Decarboxylating) n=1 Tax=Loktanella fryxellensis TaxID=245187 RepID=A0A1H8AZB2_9RHOB|nr:precorrin-6y C5,15-methyltransferase (decarboxylating) subunit CbiE [Loktanella fryxellensis]SEM75249.1 precorrin-6Y C5,15-methyltransferase (decarboxylating) [Loktanella fryxellensis]